MRVAWHAQSTEQILKILETGRQGLDGAEAATRRTRYGPNALAEAQHRSLFAIFLSQFSSPLIYVLMLAAGAVYIIGEATDAYIIAAVLVLNAIIGSVQEGRAQNTLLALRKLVQSKAVVVRGGQELSIPDTQVVPGDVLMLREGERVAADARLIEEQGLRLDESMLTGESLPIEKTTDALEQPNLSVADRRNMVFKGTTVAAGQGVAVAVTTGTETVVGGISTQVALIGSEVPLRREIRGLSHVIVGVVAGISLILLVAGLLQGRSVSEMLAVVISLAVSVIPEGLPIVVTIVLATGVHRMARRNALVKRLQAVQALGRVDIIGVDKTGTITRNELVVRRLQVGARQFEVTGNGYEDVGEITEGGTRAADDRDLTMLCRVAALTATADVAYDEATKTYRVLGDPTEAALKVLAAKAGVRDEYRATRVDEIPFDSKRRFRAVLHALPDRHLVAVVGAPEVILPLCDGVSEQVQPVFDAWAKDGLRVLAVAYADTDGNRLSPERLPRLRLAGLVGMQDDMRVEVPDAVRRCQEAGVRVVMITGDHLLAGKAIASKAGIYQEGDGILTGQELAALSPEALRGAVENVSVFARTTPDQKLAIIQAWRSLGLVVAMTGDGVNDASSLVAADLGVVMGRSGTEVAKEAADIVLLDDNLSSIVAAIEEGRSIYKTIKKVILYLFSTSAGEVLTISGALLLGWPLPLLAGQIIWLNLVTDGFLDVALAMDPKEPNLLRPEFKSSRSGLLDRLMAVRIGVMALPMAVGTLWVFSQYLSNGDLARGMTMALTTLAIFQWFNVYNCRFNRTSVFSMDWRGNYYLLGATGIVVGLQLLAVYAPFMQKILRTVPLSGTEWLLATVVATSIVVVEEVRKSIVRRTT